MLLDPDDHLDGDVDAKQVAYLVNTRRAGYVDLSEVRTEHVEPHEDMTIGTQARCQDSTDVMVALVEFSLDYRRPSAHIAPQIIVRGNA